MKKVVNAIIFNKKNNSFLIIKRKNEEIHSGKWAFPGGIVEKGETEKQALIREIHEEVGLEIKDVLKKVANYFYNRPNNSKTQGISYLVSPKSFNVVLNEEIENFKWIKIENFENLNFIEGLDFEVMKALFE